MSDDKDEANDYYHMYLAILSDVCGFEMEVDNNNAVLLYNDGELVSVIMAGTDPELGYFLQVSFSL